MRVYKLLKVSLLVLFLSFYISCNMTVADDDSANEITFATETLIPVSFTLFNENDFHVLDQQNPYNFSCVQECLVFHYAEQKFERILSGDMEILFYPGSEGKVLIYANNEDITDTGVDDKISDENATSDTELKTDTDTDITKETEKKDKTLEENIKELTDTQKTDDKKKK